MGMDLVSGLNAAERCAVAALKERLVDMLGTDLLSVVLFGSKARGDAEPASDVDIAIIVRGLTPKIRDEILDRVAELEVEHLLPLSTLVLSADEFERLRRRERRLARDIEREGVPL